MFERIRAEAETIGRMNETRFSFTEPVVTPPALTDKTFQKMIDDTAKQLGFTTKLMPSGAGHDAPEVAAIAVVMVIRSDRPGPGAVPSPQPAATAPLAAVVSVEEAGTPADEESWRVFAALATEADPAGSAFSSPAPGVAEGAVLEMTDEERGELVRLLESELAQPRVRSRG